MAKKYNKVGRPAIYATPAELQANIDKYLLEHKDSLSVVELSLELGFCNRSSLIDYMTKNKNKQFSSVIKKAISRIEAFHEKKLYGNAPTGSIFWLKNHNWSDKIDNNVSGSIDIKIVKH
jgi:hypothetical protein